MALELSSHGLWGVIRIVTAKPEELAALPAWCLPVGDTQYVGWYQPLAQPLGELLHIFTCLVFHSLLWMCPRFEQMLGSVREPRGSHLQLVQ